MKVFLAATITFKDDCGTHNGIEEIYFYFFSSSIAKVGNICIHPKVKTSMKSFRHQRILNIYTVIIQIEVHGEYFFLNSLQNFHTSGIIKKMKLKFRVEFQLTIVDVN